MLIRASLRLRIAAVAGIAAAGAIVSLAPHARADERATVPGVQDDPPAPPAPAAHPPLDSDAGQRRAVRGCSLDNDCRDPRRALLEFELEAFPRADDKSPWMDGDDAMGHDAVRYRGISGGATARPLNRRGAAARSPDPLKLRPDLPWLAELELPDLPVYWDHRIIKYLEFYKDDPRGRAIMSGWLRDQGKFGPMIRRKLRDAGLPESLLYVAMIESSYDVWEYSRVGASGLWQFMPGTGRIYGLTITRWVDERNDPLRSTEAAIMMFEDLYQRFGDWDLALAAYNAGYGNVIRSVAKYNTNDFWRLITYEAGLPWGTSLYVPKALATAIVGENLERFGFERIDREEPHVFETVRVPTSVSFSVIARAAGCSESDIVKLNPHLRRKRTPPGEADYVVRIPAGRRGVFSERFPQLRGDWDQYDAYVVQHGERFEDIATEFGIDYSALATLNGIDDEAEVGGGMVLVVPRASAATRAHNRKQAEEDLYRAGVPEGGEEDELLIVAVPDKDERVAGKQRWFYRVVSGDSQWGIARTFGVSIDELAAWNGLEPNAFLHARMVLQVWTDPSFDPAARGIKVLDDSRLHLVSTGSTEHIELTEGRIGRRRTIYTVKNGGTYEDVARLYGLSRWDLARINRKPADTRLDAGDEVIVYEVVDHTKSSRAGRQADRARKKPASMKR